MKKGSIALILALVLSACHRAPLAMDSAEKEDATSLPPTAAVFTPTTGSDIAPGDVSLLEQINRENIRVIGSALPSLVRITATVPADPRTDAMHLPFQHRPFTPTQPNETAYGAGVVIKKNGYIITNSHVIEDSHEVEVQLQDHRVFPATVIASDPQVDVAILKIDADDLKPLPWGDSDKIHVGEQVFAIGNPFALGASVSRGIISATGRNIPDPRDTYQGFLQTDAAINPGNSGGALINIHGELIGINVEIASMTGADRGVGFALPSNMLRYAVANLLEKGRLHGFLGVALPYVIDEGVIAQLGLGTGEGALLAGIYPRSPAERAKLQLADFITEIDGHKVSSISELQVIAQQLPVGKEAEVQYIRNGEHKITFIKVANVPDSIERGPAMIVADDSTAGTTVDAAGVSVNALSGLQVTELDSKMRKKFQVDDWISNGVVVTGVQANSSAEMGGFEQGDIIEMVCVRRASPEQLSTVRELTRLATDLKPDQGVALLVHRGPTNRFIYLPPLK